MDAVGFHSKQAGSWEAQYESPVFSKRIAVISQLIKVPSGVWLDAGCGTGTVARWLAHHGCSVIGIDASEEMIANAQTAKGVTFEVSDVTKTRFSACYFDGIVCSSVIEYLVQPEDALREFRRILRPQGILVASVPLKNLPIRFLLHSIRISTFNRWYSYLKHSRHAFSHASLKSTLRDCGFDVAQQVDFGNIELPFGFTIPARTLTMVRCH